MSKPPDSEKLEGEHIFPASRLTPLALKWKELNAAGKHREAMLVLEEIVVGSSTMFARLAQYENYQFTVDLSVLVSAAQEKVVKWLLAWNPKKGRLFTWFSRCAKNAFRSELNKANQYRRRFHTTSDNLEMFYGAEDHEVEKKDLASEVENKLKGITCRWGDPQEISAIRFLIYCIIDDDHDKHASIRAAAYANGISMELSKFFYAWAVTALRHQMYDKVRVPFTEQDLIMASTSYEHLPGLRDILKWEEIKKIIVVFGGLRLRIPTAASILRLKEDYATFVDIDNTDLDPDSVAKVAKARKRSVRSAYDAYHEMAAILDPKRSGEHDVFDEHDS